MAEYLSDFDDVDDDFEYDGCPYCFKTEYTDEELLERRMQKQREEKLAIFSALVNPGRAKEACES